MENILNKNLRLNIVKHEKEIQTNFDEKPMVNPFYVADKNLADCLEENLIQNF
jgi:hypothetical protein